MAINTLPPESCGYLFSLQYRNTQPEALFYPDMTGALRVSRIQTQGNNSSRTNR